MKRYAKRTVFEPELLAERGSVTFAAITKQEGSEGLKSIGLRTRMVFSPKFAKHFVGQRPGAGSLEGHVWRVGGVLLVLVTIFCNQGIERDDGQMPATFHSPKTPGAVGEATRKLRQQPCP